jgi:hypothetical protein
MRNLGLYAKGEQVGKKRNLSMNGRLLFYLYDAIIAAISNSLHL